ncbi:MAG: radical SAM protein [Candidatus Omnitrophota bacterium]
MVKRQKAEFKQMVNYSITKGNLKVVCSDSGINIYWNGLEVTTGPGLNASINTLGLWTDSTKADWQILDRGRYNFRVKVTFRELPLSQIWLVKIIDECLYLNIDIEMEEWLSIDEFRVVCSLNSGYKTWFHNSRQEDFPRQNNDWQDICLENFSTSLTGVRFPLEGKSLPPLALKCRNGKEQIFALIQRPPLNIDAYFVGFKYMNFNDKKRYGPGHYHLFSGMINLFENDNLLDQKIEALRRNHFRAAIRKKVENRSSKNRLKVLLANFPWQRQGDWGVRAGSRWPHIKDKSENNYLPFPFFLAYATALLRKNNIEVKVIDAIAEATTEDEFVDNLFRMKFDILVTETSVPSFYYDREILRKISPLNIPVILCGPHPEIYKPEFLAGNEFVDFVLFGEYEITLLELVKAISQGKKDFSFIKGLIWRDQNRAVVKNCSREPTELDSLPWPYRGKDIPMEKYWDLPGDIPHPSAQMIASRGCPFSCSFCLWPQVFFGGKVYRTRDVNDVVDEMEHLISTQGFKSVYFDDDTFNVGKDRMIRLCDEIIKRDLHSVPWAIMAKPDLMDEEILDKMKEAGLHAVKYGVESASQELVDNCGKSLDLKRTEKIIKYTKLLGINVHLTFSFGLPGETKATIKNTINYALKLDPHSVQFSIVTPFPGTALFEALDKSGRILTKDFSRYDGHYSCVFQPDNLSPADLEEAKQHAYRLWADHQRKKRGLVGDIKKFFNYWQNYSLGAAFKKTRDYLNYFSFDRRKFIGKL